jgi:hypothetical protein
MLLRWLLTGVIVICSEALFAQGNPALRSFAATPTKTTVEVQWTIAAGFQLSSPQLQWGTDSINFSTIYTYAGTAGHPLNDMTYQYSHLSPAGTGRNYYRLDLGIYGYSTVVGANLDNHRNYKMYPVPFRDRTLITFENLQNKILKLYLFDHNGQLIRVSDPFTGNTCTFERYELLAGWYYFVVSDMGSFFIAGKMAITDL